MTPPKKPRARPAREVYDNISGMKRKRLEELACALFDQAEGGTPCTQLFVCSKCRGFVVEGYLCSCGADLSFGEDDLI